MPRCNFKKRSDSVGRFFLLLVVAVVVIVIQLLLLLLLPNIPRAKPTFVTGPAGQLSAPLPLHLPPARCHARLFRWRRLRSL